VIKLSRIRLAGHVAHMGERRIAHSILVRKLGGRRPLGRSGRREENNIKIYLKRNGSGNCELDSGYLGYGQVLGCFKCGNEHFFST
jgi:hypothetical protein